MRHAIVLLVLLAISTMAGCAKHIYSTPPSKKPTKPRTISHGPKTKPYAVMGKTYYPLQSASGYTEVGKASWYGKDFHGKKTANGQIYNMHGFSAAHKTLPLGTKVRVTNLENNRSLVLVVNDRGPFVNERILDLSYGAAKKLDAVERGVIKVRIVALGSMPTARPTRSIPPAPTHFHVRVGAFANRKNAERTHHHLVAIGFTGADIKTVNRNGRRLHIVRAGSYTSRAKAEKVQDALKNDFPTCYIVS